MAERVGMCEAAEALCQRIVAATVRTESAMHGHTHEAVDAVAG